MTEEAEATPETPTKKAKRLPLTLILAVVGVVVLLTAGLGGAFALGLFGDSDRATATAENNHAAADADHGADAHGGDTHDGDGHGHDMAGEPVFVDLPQLLVNLVVAEGRPRFLKLALAVEVSDEHTAQRINDLEPRIVDSFQLFLRTLTPEELQGPGAMFRLKEGLHVRIDQAIEPSRVRNVLFKEMLVQ